MKKNVGSSIFLCLAVLLLWTLSYAQTQDVASELKELKTELQQKGLTQADIVAVEKPVKEMLSQGANKEDIKKTLVDLSSKGVTGGDLKASASSMSGLVKSGVASKEVGSIVSRAVKQAHAKGLKGKDLAAKVHEAIKQRKTEMEQVKAKIKEKQKEMQGKTEKIKKGMDKETQEQQKMMKGKWGK